MLGIDVSKAELVCALLDQQAEKFQWERPFPNSTAGVTRLLALTPAEVPWILEPTGRYSITVAAQARAAGRTVLLAPPRKAKAYLQSLTSRAKTDRLDARGLALFAASRPKTEALRPYPLKTDSVDQLEQLLTARRGLVDALSSLEQRIAELPHAARVLTAAVADLRTQRDAVDQEIAQLTGKKGAFPLAAQLRQIPGIGPVIGAALAARLSARTFTSSDEFVAYVGLDVGVVQSGKRKGERGLTKQGDAELRRLLYLAAAANVRSQSPFGAQYRRELAKGLSKIGALNAVARKLARVSWSLAKHGGDYQAARVNQPAQTPPKAPPT
jgi:transposase